MTIGDVRRIDEKFFRIVPFFQKKEPNTNVSASGSNIDQASVLVELLVGLSFEWILILLSIKIVEESVEWFRQHFKKTYFLCHGKLIWVRLTNAYTTNRRWPLWKKINLGKTFEETDSGSWRIESIFFNLLK